ncbi:MAG: putative Ig domain-containing protein, partial [Blastocatellia bacterium]
IQNGGFAGGFLTGTLDFSNGFSTPFSLNSNSEGTITFPEQRNISWARLTGTTTRAAGPSLLEFIVAGSYTEPRFRINEGAGRLGNNKASSGTGPGICNPATNRPPVIASAPPITAQPGVAYSYQAQVSDPNNDPLVFSLSSAPSGMTINTAGLITWTPEAGQVGDAAVTLQVSDGRGGVASQSYTINVASPPGVNRPPQITSTPSGAVTLGQTYQYDVAATDPDGDVIVFSLLAPPAGAAIDAFSGLITWTPNSSQVSVQSFIVIAEDGRGGRDPQSFAVEVRPSTDPLPPGLRDQDGDGFDESVDCNDTNANINPARNEILGNGLDDDCNPATPDVIPASSVSCSLVSNKRSYKANSVAQLTIRARNISSNLSVTGLAALLRVT